MDKGGNFIGWLYFDNVNLSVALVEEGLAKVHFTAERSGHFKALQHAETKAKDAKLNVSRHRWFRFRNIFGSSSKRTREKNVDLVLVPLFLEIIIPVLT